jgi:hypothetical protein
MSDANGKDADGKKMTTALLGAVAGNPLFEKAVAAVGLDDTTTRWLLVSVLNTIGAAPTQLTPDELGNLLPEVDRRLRKLVPDAQADAAVKRLYRLLFTQAESA